ncbi:hypothetical protein Bbelb_253400 [Branchiostoma belcheri]|nr:hypothetical protein Bbelb_253400 [Branchiostoma belcheri]
MATSKPRFKKPVICRLCGEDLRLQGKIQHTRNLFRKVHLQYPSDKRARAMDVTGIETMIHQLLERKWGVAATSAMKHEGLSPAIREKVGATITKEVQSLTPRSVLQKTAPDDLVHFNMEEFSKELESQTPWFETCPQAACGQQSQSVNIAKSTAASILIKVKHPTCSAIQYTNSFVLLQGG